MIWEGSHPHPRIEYGAGSALCRRGRGGRGTPHQVPIRRGQRADTWVRPYARRERGKRGRLCLRGNDPCRLRPAHQGMKMAPPSPVRVDDSSRGLDTGPVSSTGQAFRRYDGCGRLTSIFVPTTVWLPSRLLTFDPRIEYGAGSSTSLSTGSGEPGRGQASSGTAGGHVGPPLRSTVEGGVTLTPALSRQGRGGRGAGSASAGTTLRQAQESLAQGWLRGAVVSYDAEFVVLARTLGVPLVTLDGGILGGAGDVAVGLGE